ncbi:MAG: 4-oxalocrotonate tautomerase [Rhodopseudomonas sp.]|uniref:tautomerase family protein n=1 Tax=Rhodopseudomonas sp. TaxID=1078 RepID=UPI0039E42379
MIGIDIHHQKAADMPGITLTISLPLDPALTGRLAAALAELTCRVLRKELDRTAVFIRHHPADQWFIAGRALSDWRKNAFKLEVTITDETNTKAEKAAYHREVFALLSELIGDLHPHSNIHVIDCRAAAYGYGGITQEAYAYRAPG